MWSVLLLEEDMTRPTDCAQCKMRFESSPLLQAEMLHLAATVGEGAARAELNDRLEEEHIEHADDPWVTR